MLQALGRHRSVGEADLAADDLFAAGNQASRTTAAAR